MSIENLFNLSILNRLKQLIKLSLVCLIGSLGTVAAADPAPLSTVSCGIPGGAIFTTGALPDEKTAAAVAVQILNGVYGNKLISQQLPLSVVLQGDRYTINGVRRKIGIGGHATIILCKSNAAVIFMSHSK